MSAIDAFTNSSVPSTGNGFTAMSSEDFLRVMFAELANQDPLAPNETKDLLEQVGTVRSIESDLALTERLEAIVAQNEMTSAGAFIGTYVIGRTEFNDLVEDFVGSVSITDNGPVLNLINGYSVPIDRVQEIIDPQIAQALLAGAGETPPAA